MDNRSRNAASLSSFNDTLWALIWVPFSWREKGLDVWSCSSTSLGEFHSTHRLAGDTLNTSSFIIMPINTAAQTSKCDTELHVQQHVFLDHAATTTRILDA